MRYRRRDTESVRRGRALVCATTQHDHRSHRTQDAPKAHMILRTGSIRWPLISLQRDRKSSKNAKSRRSRGGIAGISRHHKERFHSDPLLEPTALLPFTGSIRPAGARAPAGEKPENRSITCGTREMRRVMKGDDDFFGASLNCLSLGSRAHRGTFFPPPYAAARNPVRPLSSQKPCTIQAIIVPSFCGCHLR